MLFISFAQIFYCLTLLDIKQEMDVTFRFVVLFAVDGFFLVGVINHNNAAVCHFPNYKV